MDKYEMNNHLIYVIIKVKRIFLILIFFCYPFYCGHIEANSLLLKDYQSELTITQINKHVIRITIVPIQSDGSPMTLTESPVLKHQNFPSPFFRTRALNSAIEIPQDSLKISINPDPFTINFHHSENINIPTLMFGNDSGNVNFEFNDIPLFGLGEGAKQYDRRKAFYPMENGSSYWKMEKFGGRIPIPWIISPEGWVFFYTDHLVQSI